MAQKLIGKDEKDPGWLPTPDRPDACPEGLEYLLNFDEIWMIQEKAWVEELKHWMPKARFSVLNAHKQQLYFVQEESTTSDRLWGLNREFTLKAHDESGKVLIVFHRPFKMRAALFSWLNWETTGWHLEVECPPGKPLGIIKQVTSGIHKRFDIFDAAGTQKAHVKGPVFELQLIKEDVDFEVLAPDRKSNIGSIVRKFSGWKKEILTDAQNYHLKIPGHIDVGTKALLMGTTFLIEYMCYENTAK